MNKNVEFHEPVLAQEVLDNLGAPLNSQAEVIDATLGSGGHSLEMAKKGYRVLGIEADPEILEIARQRLGGKAKLVHGNFRAIDKIAREAGFAPVQAVLFDLGVSNLTLTDTTRGFSFGSPEAKLDMRLDKALQGLTAAGLLNALREDQLAVLFGRIFKHFEAKALARAVIRFREGKKIETVSDLIAISKVLRPKGHLNQATLPFLAVRIAVNSELENLSEALPKAFELLVRGGRLLVITFHSLEREIVKEFFNRMTSGGLGKVVTRQPVLPKAAEIEANPRSRSAELRIIEKI